MDEYPEYKAKRNKTPDEFSSQLPLIEEVLDALRIPFLKKEGYEADDIIATLVTQALADDLDVLILTGDRDSLQLVTDHSTVLYPMRGVSDLARMTPEAVETKYGVPPHRYPELAALVGEDSDNLPGVPGVGPKTAAKWITQYDGLDNVITHADEIKGKAGDNLRAHLGDVIRNRRLNALVRDLDLELHPTDLAVRPWDRQEVHTLFDSLEFRVLRDRLFETLQSEEEIDDSGFEMARAAAGRRRGRRLAGRPRPRRERAHRRARSRAPGAPAPARSGRSRSPRRTAPRPGSTRPRSRPRTTPRSRPGSPTREPPKVLHDAKGPMLALSARGWPLAGLVSDTALAAYLVRPDQRSYDLADLTLRYLKRELKQERRRRRPAQPRQPRRAPTPAPPRPRCCTPVPSSTSPRRSTRRSRSTAAPGCSPRSSCRWSTCSRRWSAPASRSTSTTSRRWRATSPAR